MTDVAGSGLGRNAKDLKTGKTLTTYNDWNAVVNSCMTNSRLRIEGNQRQSDVLVRDVFNFMGLK